MNNKRATALRAQSIVKISVVLLAFYLLCRYGLRIPTGISAAGVLGILLFALLSEWIALYADRCVSGERLNLDEQAYLAEARRCLEADTGLNLERLKLYVLPDSDRMTARAYGVGRIAVTRGALRCDQGILRALLCHELYIGLSGDRLFKRVVFAVVGVAMVALTVCSLAATISLWLVFFFLAMLGLCGKGVLSLFVMHGLSKGVKGFFSLCQRAVLFVYQVCSGLLSRRTEYQADRFTVDAGAGSGMLYFLSRFAEESAGKQTLRDALYDSHPPKDLRIARIRQYMEETRDLQTRN